MALTPLFGALRLEAVQELGRVGDESWALMRREEDGARFLLHLFDPRPDDRRLESLKNAFLTATQEADPSQPVETHFGYDEQQAWHLQRLEGQPLARAWAGWTAAQREEAWRAVERRLARLGRPTLLHPEAIQLRPGRILFPRTLGSASPWSLEEARALLPQTPGSGEESPLWDLAPELGDEISRPARGRGQEATYLKSLMLGLSAPAPMERIVAILGEEGIGKAQMGGLAIAAAEADGLWSHRLEAQAESAGDLVGRIAASALLGLEAEFYAQHPGPARALSRRVPAYAFMGGGRPRQESPLEPEEVTATLQALDFAAMVHPRLMAVLGLERADGEALAALRELVDRSTVAWLLTADTGTRGAGLRPLLAHLKGHPSSALLHLNRLEDDDLRGVLDDLLDAHQLPPATVAELLRHALGNPGLLRNLLERAQHDGSLIFTQGRWTQAPGRPLRFEAESDLVNQVFIGRLQRMLPGTAVLVRLLAAADRSLPNALLAAASGLNGDALDEALHGAAASKLVQVQSGEAGIPDARWRDLVRAHTPRAELRRLAKSLLGVLPQAELQSVRALALQTLAADEASGLSELMKALDRPMHVPPREAEGVLRQALPLEPAPLERARLQEWLGDAWAHGGSESDEASGEAPGRHALAAYAQAQEAAAEAEAGPTRSHLEARLLRKQASVHLQLRQADEARRILDRAFDLTRSDSNHPEHARLRLALGKWYLLRGDTAKGIQLLEEGQRYLIGGQAPARDQAAIMLELGRALGHQGQFARAAHHLESAQRLLEVGQDPRGQVPIQLALGQMALALGDPSRALNLLSNALQVARAQGDPVQQAQAHLALGSVRSLLEQVSPALAHLERATDRFQRQGLVALSALSRLWRARTLAAMGDLVAAEHQELQALSAPATELQAGGLESGDRIWLQGEIAALRGAWKEAERLQSAAAERYAKAGLPWRARLAELRALQATARAARKSGAEAPETAWSKLEALKAPVEASASPWLEFEWARAQALCLACLPASEPVDLQALQAWGEALALARRLQFPTAVLEASLEGAELMLRHGERMGAMARLQDSFPSFQQVWLRLPEGHDQSFLGREDIHRYRTAVEAAGLKLPFPERMDPLADWTPTQANLPAPGSRA
ncbi:MAG: tetratricopeptide repeat protein [Acidobacteria bacterium]|nr:tetratricopeptide repeat protein [Acidobacteriota bacterium]